MTVDSSRLAAVISPLRRTLLAAAREREDLPEIPDAQVEVLRALPRGTVASPSDLAEALGVGRSTVSNLLATMEDAGLIARRASAVDRRRVEVVATPRALGWFDRFDAAAAALVAEAMAALDPGDRAALESSVPALERLRDGLVDLRHAAGAASPEASRTVRDGLVDLRHAAGAASPEASRTIDRSRKEAE
ncbi:MarR family winged helix-turn-helix transcriptional regulator [Microbacterium hominis]|uniref:MarR family transcriptional regulator n=1 Tax=Microbacterium hominis TaxID=162426 RepID=A0A7D4PZW5_9MICO|nr:MarR family transcriptional regulator [Microbacterium hominis]QKJ18378.1 MarR family transcriptional regulator [Microbacterium hominis]